MFSTHPAAVSSKDIQKARRLAKRTRAAVACVRCKWAKVKCNDYRPCKQCTDSVNLCVDGSVQGTADVEQVEAGDRMSNVDIFPGDEVRKSLIPTVSSAQSSFEAGFKRVKLFTDESQNSSSRNTQTAFPFPTDSTLSSITGLQGHSHPLRTASQPTPSPLQLCSPYFASLPVTQGAHLPPSDSFSNAHTAPFQPCLLPWFAMESQSAPADLAALLRLTAPPPPAALRALLALSGAALPAHAGFAPFLPRF